MLDNEIFQSCLFALDSTGKYASSGIWLDGILAILAILITPSPPSPSLEHHWIEQDHTSCIVFSATQKVNGGLPRIKLCMVFPLPQIKLQPPLSENGKPPTSWIHASCHKSRKPRGLPSWRRGLGCGVYDDGLCCLPPRHDLSLVLISPTQKHSGSVSKTYEGRTGMGCGTSRPAQDFTPQLSTNHKCALWNVCNTLNQWEKDHTTSPKVLDFTVK